MFNSRVISVIKHISPSSFNGRAVTCVRSPLGFARSSFIKHGDESISSTSSLCQSKFHGPFDVEPERWTEKDFHLMQPIYCKRYVETVRPRHHYPHTLSGRIGLRAVLFTRSNFDLITGYTPDRPMTEEMWLRRIIFLETVAGVPGMVGGMARHLKSLRTMSRDNGWIHTLLEEAENERMHLLVFLSLKQPGMLFRGMVITSQGIFFNLYFAAYLLSPKTCHAFVGYLEEEAVKTYTHALKEIDAGRLWSNRPAPQIGIEYWKLDKNATMRDLVLAVRADEAAHCHVNHTFAGMPHDQSNPFKRGTHEVI